MNIDEIDKRIMALLQKDAKYTNKELSSKLGLSITAIYERVKKLEKNGIIKKYVAILEQQFIDKSFVVFCNIKLDQHKQEYVIKFEKDVRKLQEVMECYHISGDFDYLLKVIVKDMKGFRAFMVEKLTKIDHIGSTHSTFMINEVKHTTEIEF